MALTNSQLRNEWSLYDCAPRKLQTIDFGPDQIRVAPPTVEAWQALWTVINAHGYTIRTGDTDSYSCRGNASGTGKSLHSYGIALDINWDTNPWIDHPGVRNVRYSSNATQAGRARDVSAGKADTDMTAAMIADVLAIRTKAGDQVFKWGGNWNTVKDCMHFEIELAPKDLAVGIDWTTVKASVGSPGQPMRVIARNGLNLRGGPGVGFAVIQLLPFGTVVHVLRHDDDWVLVDLEGDARADGHVFRSFLALV